MAWKMELKQRVRVTSGSYECQEGEICRIVWSPDSPSEPQEVGVHLDSNFLNTTVTFRPVGNYRLNQLKLIQCEDPFHAHDASDAPIADPPPDTFLDAVRNLQDCVGDLGRVIAKEMQLQRIVDRLTGTINMINERVRTLEIARGDILRKKKQGGSADGD